jgi:hypothetical protein
VTAAATSQPAKARRAFAAFKAGVYLLLATNVLLYTLHGSLAETVDTAAWVVLLLLFEAETGGWRIAPWQRRPMHGLRLLAGTAVLWACLAYASRGEWLDFANAATWLGVVVALELELRVSEDFVHFHSLRRRFTWLLYAALAGFALLWLLQAAWLDAWDATLWLVAFVAIELNVFGLVGAQSS